jgi:hypothetical protein
MTELLPVPYFHVVLPCQLVLILCYTSAKNSVILCLRRLGKRYNNLAKQEVQMGMIAVLHTGGSNWACILTCTALSRRRSGQRGAMENSRSNGIPVKALSKVLERSFAKTQSKSL